MIIKKKVFNKVIFEKLNRGEDTTFLKKAFNCGFKIQSSNIDDFVYIRYTNNNNHHTYNVELKDILGNKFNIIDNKELKNKLILFISR